MKTIRRLLLLTPALALTFITACNGNEGSEDIPKSDAVTTAVTAFTASLSGNISDVTVADMLSGLCGVLYSEKSNAQETFNSWADGNDNPDCQTFMRARANSDGSISSQLDKLIPETSYSFCFCYKSKSGKIRKISQTGTFTTKQFSHKLVTGDVTEIRYFDAKIDGQAKVNADDLKMCKTGIIFSDNAENVTLKDNVLEANEVGNDGSFTIPVNKLTHNTSYYYRTYLYVEHINLTAYGEIRTAKTNNVDDMAIDLGLSVKWANSDFMAQTPEEDGVCFAWGMNKSLRKGSVDVYEHYADGSYIDIGKSICGNPEYDVVTQVYGGKWRMPSESEVIELFGNCTVEFITEQNTVYLVFKAKNNAIMKMSSLAPWSSATGHSSTGKTSYRWTGTLSETDESRACTFQSNTEFSRYINIRHIELCIRPVCDY